MFPANIARFSMAVLQPVVRSLMRFIKRAILSRLHSRMNNERCPFFWSLVFSLSFFWKLFHFFNMWWSWIKMNFFKFALSNLLNCLFFIRCLINKYIYVTFILNSKKKFIICVIHIVPPFIQCLFLRAADITFIFLS